ncbi:MAG: tetratricopeptide repeat protein [Oscillospiraceae bacterium]|nr:tetratricopeptide repeat protein [Oscillospiraceae bacterium]
MDRYNRLFRSDETEYFESSPVIIEAKALLYDNETDKNIAQVKFINISSKNITAVFADITAYDPSREVVEKVSHTYIDLAVKRDENFGAKSPAALNNKPSRSFDVVIRKVVFGDESVWENNGYEKNIIPKPKDLTEYFGNDCLTEQYRKRHGASAKYVPQKISDIWICACGKINHSEEGECFSCKQSFSALTESLDVDGLTSDCYNYAKDLMAKAISESDFKEAAGKFTSIKDHLDSAALAAECKEKAECARKDRLYNSAAKLMKNDTVKSLEEAAELFKSISDWKDFAEMLSQCESRINELINNQAAAAARQIKAEKRKKGIIATVCGAVALCVVFATVNATVIVPASNYKEAAALMESGSYGEAAQMFAELGDYKDSYDLSLLAQYNNGVTLFNNRQYDEAVQVFEKLGNYNNSKEMIPASKYNKGIALFNSGSYDEAAQVFGELGDYSNSKEMKLVAIYNKGSALIESGDYDEAISIFDSLTYYFSDAEEKKQSACYYKGKYLFDNKNYKSAVYAFKSSEDYEDSAQLCLESMYQYALNSTKLPEKDITKYNYLKELAEENYADSAKIFTDTYKISVEVIANNSNKDTVTDTNVFKSGDAVYVHIKFSGAPDNVEVLVKCSFEYQDSKGKWTNNSQRQTFHMNKWSIMQLPRIYINGYEDFVLANKLPLNITYTYTDENGKEVTNTLKLTKN